jgi:hypothetical protein
LISLLASTIAALRPRGPLEFLTSTTLNNLLHSQDALTLTAAGAFKTRELQYYAANYRQVLTGEGLPNAGLGVLISTNRMFAPPLEPPSC